MIRTNTTFILGAGASCPYGFPAAYDLYDRICSGTIQTPPVGRGSPGLQRMAEAAFGDFRQELTQSGQMSVDTFLEHRTDLVDIGKRAIACALIPFEYEDELFRSNRGPRWYEYLYAAMTSPLPEFRRNAVQILTFNYDRSLEHFLTSSLAATHGVPLTKAWEELQHIPIVHLYGDLGAYTPDGRSGRRYVTEITPSAVQICGDSLKIVHEDVTDDAEFEQARSILAETERVIFLGFAFHTANVERLQLQAISNKVAFYASAFGLTILDRLRAQRLVGSDIDMGETEDDALQFLRKHIELG